ncbi:MULTISPECIES: PTS lactose/cellobiose transporter subunit IIA [unclassified Paenibacillus]|uniref:PTS lactose/cellobiose transporter subunit IIA n=1 Tax=unclassified Paenibacillus TaxID=185978 RepID=UPI000838FE94|nr:MULTISPECIES: PTS lactose/cellobiose transporter subunit IIA [unclassified Paenibacillus]NWL88077.1 PTS lactose/cellobiose transporter subunit IIA [Paenibacillus sp. 79R4]
MEKVTLEELALISMEVIMHAGKSRDCVFQAVDKASKGEFDEADKLMAEANNEITIAHKAQTKTLQKEAEGVEFPFSPLFGHAQDTLMTVKSEMNVMREIIKLYKRL